MLFWKRKIEAPPDLRAIKREYKDAEIKIEAIKRHLKNPRTTREQAQRLREALPAAEARIKRLKEEFEKALKLEHEEDIQRTLDW